MMTKTDLPSDEKLNALARDQYVRPLPKRFYKIATVTDGNGVALDGKVLQTPMKAPLVLPNRTQAEAVAEEWRQQVEVINTAAMTLTKLANTAIDRTPLHRDDILDEIVAYAGSDLVCYRADHPSDLVKQQAVQWDPVLTWTNNFLSSSFSARVGIGRADQNAESLHNFRAQVTTLSDFELTVFHATTALTGSALLTSMVLQGEIDVEIAWSAANLEEFYQIKHWGLDFEAEKRMKWRRKEFMKSVQFYAMV